MKKPRITFRPQRTELQWVVETEYNKRAVRLSSGNGVSAGFTYNPDTHQYICGVLFCETLPKAVDAAARYCKIASLPLRV